jgi:hypothetical protein
MIYDFHAQFTDMLAMDCRQEIHFIGYATPKRAPKDPANAFPHGVLSPTLAVADIGR